MSLGASVKGFTMDEATNNTWDEGQRPVANKLRARVVIVIWTSEKAKKPHLQYLSLR
jgi:hypothetical protein